MFSSVQQLGDGGDRETGQICISSCLDITRAQKTEKSSRELSKSWLNCIKLRHPHMIRLVMIVLYPVAASSPLEQR